MSAARIAALILLGALCAYALYAWAYIPWQCMIALQDLGGATSMAMGAKTGYDAALQARANLARIAALEHGCRADIRLYMIKASNERVLGRHEDALETYRRALTVEPRTEVYEEMGLLLAEMGRFDEAAAPFATAIRFSPDVQVRVDTFSEELGKKVRERIAREKRGAP